MKKLSNPQLPNGAALRPEALLQHQPPPREGASASQAWGGRKGSGGRCVCRGGAGTRPHRNRRERWGGAGGGVSVHAGGAGAAGERLRCDPSASLTCAAPVRPRWRRIQRRMRERLRRRRRRAGKGRAQPRRALGVSAARRQRPVVKAENSQPPEKRATSAAAVKRKRRCKLSTP